MQLSKPAWLKIKEDEMKKLIAGLSSYQPAQIGLILRDQYGIPTTRIYGKKLKEYLKELRIKSNLELENAEKKLEKIKTHLKKNITDKKTKHKIQKAQSHLNRLKKYHLRKQKKEKE